jgi:3-hydroxybutyryl-CoA dehydrogenase
VSQPNPSERLGIVGSGTIAAGLAKLAGEHGDVVVWARSETSAERVTQVIEDAARVVTELEALREATLVIEAVVEDERVKHGVHELLGDLLPDDVLIGTTTSSLPIGPIAAAGGRPERFGATHFFNPVEKMELVELAFPDEATEDTRRRFTALCKHLDKTPVEVPAIPGFVVNRLLFPYLFAAVRMLEENGVEPDAVDTCMKLGAAHPMGPLAVLDLVGLDVSAAIADSIGIEVPRRVRTLVDEGRLGKKSGGGFFDY